MAVQLVPHSDKAFVCGRHDPLAFCLFREILDSVLQGLDLVMALFEDTPSQLHDSVVPWKTNEPDFDRCMRHFYPREIPDEDMQGCVKEGLAVTAVRVDLLRQVGFPR